MRKTLIVFLVAFSLLASGSVALGQGFAGWFDIEPATRFRQVVWFNGAVTTDAAVTVGTDVTVGDDLTVADDINTADLIGSTYTTITLGFGGTITPTGLYQLLTASAARGTSSVANPTAGRVVTLVNIGSNTITLTDTGVLRLAGNVVLGQYDTVTLIGDGTNWIQIGTSNN